MRALRIAVALFTVAVFIACAAAPEDAARSHARDAWPEASDSVRHDLSPALRDLSPVRSPSTSHPALRVPRPAFAPGFVSDPPTPENLSFAPVLAIPATTRNFDGVGQGFSGPAGTFTITSAPPDTIGDVGPNHYVQMVNTSFAIFNKAGTAVLGPLATNTLFSGFGGACQTDNDGDGAVLYDPIADRWVLAQFAVTTGGATGPFFLCVAVSQTPDPTGAWYRYAFSFVNFPDYPKLGVWPDAYYITFNMFTNTFQGAKVCAYDRASMLTGAPATQQCYQLSTSYGGLLPADVDGTNPPPAGAPNPVLNFGSNALNLWRFHVDWTTPGKSTFSGPVNVAVASFSRACNGSNCVPQPGTSQKLDSLGDRLMYRLAYRNLGD